MYMVTSSHDHHHRHIIIMEDDGEQELDHVIREQMWYVGKWLVHDITQLSVGA